MGGRGGLGFERVRQKDIKIRETKNKIKMKRS